MRFVVSAVMATVVVCAATSANSAVAVKGGGAGSCGTWISDRSERSTSAVAREEWVLGFLSALNEAFNDTPGAHDALAKTDADAIFGWMDNYCRAHPLDQINTAAGLLMVELRNRAQ